MPPDPNPLLAGTPFVPVLTIENAAQAVPLAHALAAGGLSVIEVTLRTAPALAAMRAIIAELPQMIVGAGTVTSPADVRAAQAAGARFLVSPGTPAGLADALAAASVPALPGCATVSEAMALAERGFKLLKFFPAEASGGIAWLKAVAEPLPGIRFCPTGDHPIECARLSRACQRHRGGRFLGRAQGSHCGWGFRTHHRARERGGGIARLIAPIWAGA